MPINSLKSPIETQFLLQLYLLLFTLLDRSTDRATTIIDKVIKQLAIISPHPARECLPLRS